MKHPDGSLSLGFDPAPELPLRDLAPALGPFSGRPLRATLPISKEGCRAFMGDVDGEKEARDQNEISLAEYAKRIGEVHHRVKNNLQVIVSLFSLQAARTTQPEVLDMLGEMQNRVRAIAYIHEPMYSADDFSTIHFAEYLKTFIRELESFYDLEPRVQLQLSLADLALDFEQAVPVALISNELISNALKHAFPHGRSGNISIALRYATRKTQNSDSQYCELQIVDDGIGLAPGLNFQTAESMGFYMVRILTQQLQGILTVLSNGGTSVSILFPLAAE